MKTLDLTTNVTARDGRAARIVSTIMGTDYPIGAITTGEDGTERFDVFTATGAFLSYSDGEHPNDLVVAPEVDTHFLSIGHGYTAFQHAARQHDGEWPILKVVVERGTNRLVSSEIATA